jgi:hypothetical protein
MMQILNDVAGREKKYVVPWIPDDRSNKLGVENA